MFDAGIRFEAVLEAGFALQVARATDLTDPTITYLLHEMGEETRHQRLFQRVIGQIGPMAHNPLVDHPVLTRLDRFGTGWVIGHPALLYVMVLAGEEIPDLLQQMASEHPDTDPFLAEVNRYHRQEEARHLSFARAVLPDMWRRASRDRACSGAPGGTARHHRDVRHAGAPRRVRDRRPGRLEHVEAGTGHPGAPRGAPPGDAQGAGGAARCGRGPVRPDPVDLAAALCGRSARRADRPRDAVGRPLRARRW